MIIFSLVFIIPTVIGCNDNRPTFILPTSDKIENDSSSNSNDQNTDSNYNSDINSPTTNDYLYIYYDDNIIISSSGLISNGDNYSLIANNSKIKINFENLDLITTTENKSFYFDKSSNSIIYGFKINNTKKSIDNLNKYFDISENTTISLLKSNLTLNAILIAQNFEPSESDNYEKHKNFYNKFNAKSNNFRNSLISKNENQIIFNNQTCLYYISLSTNTASIKNKIIINNNLNLKIYTYPETIEISLLFAYTDEFNNIFLTNQTITNNFSLKSENKFNYYDSLDSNYHNIIIEFAKYNF